ncbi:MAG: DUF1552 domain-containing protein [Alphaproteobacteria bacterium]|nr:DUF1552 domain-containing protein [Alphaproteobacteria bacterium]
MIGLPFLPSIASADTGLGAPPRRLVFWYVPNGMRMDRFVPTQTGPSYVLPPLLQPLSAHTDQMLVLSNIANSPAAAAVAGDHARGTACFLTCTALPDPGLPVQVGPSADHLASQAPTAAGTLYPSLHLGVQTQPPAGTCDSGYACAYQNTITWADATTPVPLRTDPEALFQALFGGSNPLLSQAELQRRHARRQSVLDLVSAEAHTLSGRLDSADRAKLDQYLTGVRSLEVRLHDNPPNGGATVCDPGPPAVTPVSYPHHVDLMSELMVKAIECDATRVLSFMADASGSYRSFAFAGVPSSHHEVSHWGFGSEAEQTANKDAWEAICLWHVQRFAAFVDRLATRLDADGSTLLENTTILFSSEVGDGHSHSHTDLPVLLVGSGQQTVQVGKHERFTSPERVSNVLLGLLDRFGANVGSHGDSTGIPSSVFV